MNQIDKVLTPKALMNVGVVGLQEVRILVILSALKQCNTNYTKNTCLSNFDVQFDVQSDVQFFWPILVNCFIVLPLLNGF